MTRTRHWDPQAVLAQASFFRELKEENRAALAAFAIPRDVPKQAILFHEGEAGHSVCLLHRGAVRLHKRTGAGETVVIKIIQPGEVFAEVVLFEQARYPVTATALSDSTVFLFPRRDFRALLRRDAFLNDFLGMLLRKQRYLTQRIAQISGADVEGRLLHFLDEHLGANPEGHLSITKREAAAAIGTAPETLSRLLRRMENEGKLTWKGKRVVRPRGFDLTDDRK